MAEHLPDVPVLIAGNGDRLLTVAARQANIIGLTGGQRITKDQDALAERVDFVRNAAGDRFDDLELNLAITALSRDGSGRPDLSIIRRALPDLSDDELMQTAAVLSGSRERDGRHRPRVSRHIRRELSDRSGQARARRSRR